MPGAWTGKLLYGLGVLSVEPRLYHAGLAVLALTPVAALLVWRKRRLAERRAGIVMIYLFAYGFFLPVILNAVFRIVIGWPLSFALSTANVLSIVETAGLLLTVTSVIYGVFIRFSADEPPGGWTEWMRRSHPAANGDGQGAFATGLDDIANEPENDADSGGDD